MTDNKFSAKKLIKWYESQKRPLPWRENRDPYRIWISEIMLQQTTTRAVINYFLRFLDKFPNVKSLAESNLEEVYEQWAGLGYYSRARNIHKSAQIISKNGFPSSFKDLLELPGFGPYTSRAVSSQAFGEKVGVVDGNVIRVYCRIFNFKKEWWNSKTQVEIQSWADQLSSTADPSEMNQALMELGATICTPKSPTCLICPWSEGCLSFKNQNQDKVPLTRPKKSKEIWIWKPQVYKNTKNELMLIENNEVSFLNNKWVFPGQALKVNKKPDQFNYKHSITHHEIYVCVEKSKNKPITKSKNSLFIKPENLAKKSPFSLMKKALQFI
jgi:A/G-specific adenine glycosylase